MEQLQKAPLPLNLKVNMRCERHTNQQDQFEQSMIAMNNSLINLLHCQQQTQNDTIHALYAIQQSQRDHANDPLITFDGKPELYCKISNKTTIFISTNCDSCSYPPNASLPTES